MAHDTTRAVNVRLEEEHHEPLGHLCKVYHRLDVRKLDASILIGSSWAELVLRARRALIFLVYISHDLDSVVGEDQQALAEASVFSKGPGALAVREFPFQLTWQRQLRVFVDDVSNSIVAVYPTNVDYSLNPPPAAAGISRLRGDLATASRAKVVLLCVKVKNGILSTQ
jgi:hypothetical protein